VTGETAPPAPPATPAIPRPAASVVLVRPGAGERPEAYMIRRQKTMRFLGGFYAFPGGRVDPADADPTVLARCHGLDAEAAARIFPAQEGVPALAFWVTAARELLEETGLLPAADGAGRPVAAGDPDAIARIDEMRRALMAEEAPLAALLAREDWYLDLAPLRYLSHFITPPSSPIRFTARFFLAPVPEGQVPRHFTEEASESFWIDPAAGVRGYEAGEMPMAEPAESGLRYLAEFPSLESLWGAHEDGRHKFHGIADRLQARGIDVPRRPKTQRLG